jgi:hypothetical protein
LVCTTAARLANRHVVRHVAERFAQARDRVVQIVLEIDEDVGGGSIGGGSDGERCRLDRPSSLPRQHKHPRHRNQKTSHE